MKKLIYILLLCLVVINSIDAQSSKKIWRLANEAFEKSNYYESLDLFLEYEKEKKLDDETKLKIGVSYFFTNNIQQSIPYLLEISKGKSDYTESAVFYLARVHHAALDFTTAIKYYKEYLKFEGGDKILTRSIYNEIKRCRSGMKLKHLSQNAYVENLGGLVNDIGNDFSPLFSFNRKGRIYFSSQRRGSTGGLRNKEGITDLENGENDFDVYFSDITNGSWSVAKRMPSFLNTVRNDVLVDFTSNGRVMHIFRSLNNYSGIIALDTFKKDRKTDLKYYYLESPVKPENGDKSIFFYNDTTLLFSSDRPGGYGGQDLYITTHSSGIWSDAVNLGSEINTAFDETSPFLANDGITLFYSSNNLKSVGGLDVFYTKFNPETNHFSTSKNIGLPINSAGDDSGFKLDYSGQQGIFSSSRKQGYGKTDIYLAYMKGKMINVTQKMYPLIVDYLQTEIIEDIQESDISQKTTININPLYYTDDNILTRKNIKQLDQLVTDLTAFPYVDISIEVYTDDIDSPNKFNLFFSIKKGEEIKKHLINNGIDPNRITIKGMGKNYPLALSFLNNKPYPFGKKMNQRIDLLLNTHNEKNLILKYNYPTVPENLKIESNKLLKKRLKGLTFRIEIANIEKMYQGEELEGYKEPYVELLPGEVNARYCIGLSSRFSAIKILYKGIQKSNPTANIVPYWDGERTTINKIMRQAEKSKDAKAYLAFIKQDK